MAPITAKGERQMTIAQAMTKAMKVFEKEGRGGIRAVKLLECYGRGKDLASARIQIEYAIDGDYTESDSAPYIVNVADGLGGIIAVQAIFY